ncbi:unnamed protein product [Rhizoctonia solani]|uniref:BTB domain-containing protein n=1 Tax=Rhizoctonia solani TaxID=456999 RepID=A0A8H3GE93_9AGAM|nr:unnamed protein product [Rhizoctonia solani]
MPASISHWYFHLPLTSPVLQITSSINMPNTTTSNDNDTSPPVTNSKFFFEDSMVVIQIENKRFKVHRSKLLESEIFADMFAVAEVSGSGQKPIEGSSADHPIILQGVNAFDFECLLTLLYARHCVQEHPKLDIPVILPAFRLVHMWNFRELREYLIPHLERGLDDIDKLVYAREFDIKEWVAPAYIRLCCRTEPLNSEEAEKIGLKGVLLIFRLREKKDPVNCQWCSSWRNSQATLKYLCPSGHSWDVIHDEADMTEKIKAWEKNGEVFS